MIQAARNGVAGTRAEVRVLVLDIDGTIVDDSNRVRDSVAQAIDLAQRRGVAVALATGRRYQSALPIHASIGSTLPLICYEGALIQHPRTGVVHRHLPLEPTVVAQILEHTERPSMNGHLSVHFYIEDDLYVSQLTDATIKYFGGSKVEPIVLRDLRQLGDRPPTKVLVLCENAETIARLSGELKALNLRAQAKQERSMSLIEAFHPAANKRSAVSYLAEQVLGLRPDNVMAMGDDVADSEMLQYAGIGVAMGNAPAAVKEVADDITTCFEEDGVARAIEKWILDAEFTRSIPVAEQCIGSPEPSPL
jgi:Cof subfamily protein (haloacid dehalogenase superfamily)